MLPAAERLAKHGIRFLGQIAPFPPMTDGLPFGQPFWGQLQCALGSRVSPTVPGFRVPWSLHSYFLPSVKALVKSMRTDSVARNHQPTATRYVEFLPYVPPATRVVLEYMSCS